MFANASHMMFILSIMKLIFAEVESDVRALQESNTGMAYVTYVQVKVTLIQNVIHCCNPRNLDHFIVTHLQRIHCP